MDIYIDAFESFTIGKGLYASRFPSQETFSLRKVNPNYNGACMLVQNEDGGDPALIGFDNDGYVDKQAIEDYYDGTSVAIRVIEWYGQFNDKRAVAPSTSLAPVIYVIGLGVLVDANNRAYLNWSGNVLALDDFYIQEDFTLLSVLKPLAVDPSNDGAILDNNTSFGRFVAHDNFGSGTWTVFSDTSTTTPVRVRGNVGTTDTVILTTRLKSGLAGTGRVKIWKNLTELADVSNTIEFQEAQTETYIGSATSGGGDAFQGRMQELALFRRSYMNDDLITEMINNANDAWQVF